MDYTKIETESAAPKASSMIETFRTIGYSLETAVADIIDNSISADACVNIRLIIGYDLSPTSLIKLSSILQRSLITLSYYGSWKTYNQ